ncbi:hypothetical protein GCM10009828_019820 [Actinoplanes couchii]|uniref:Uncharacterized protein n=2 Tax=Actinoplanes couchii TaxID=403638 RepID=A0ABQ3XDP0_9ACTN|nr:hypothetical protein Aco03nite_049870 [Actinoplanes couchii]
MVIWSGCDGCPREFEGSLAMRGRPLIGFTGRWTATGSHPLTAIVVPAQQEAEGL